MGFTKPFAISSNVDYSINALLSKSTVERIGSIQKSLESQLQNKLWLMPAAVMHITIMDWISFFPDYGQDKEKLFIKLFDDYDSAILKILNQLGPLALEFDELRATPDAIILIGKDDGSIQKIRQEFTAQVDLHPKTNPPPTIIHSTVARYKSAFILEDVEKALPAVGVIREEIKEFYLQKFVTAPINELKLIKTYPLQIDKFA